MTNTCTKETSEQTICLVQDDVISHHDKKDYLHPLLNIKEKTASIKDKLKNITDTTANNLSLLSRAAKFCYERPLWQKIAVGIGICLPLLIIGIFTNFISLIIISLVLALAYTGCSLLFDNHQTQMMQNNEEVIEVITALSDIINEVFSSLENLCKQLAANIDAFEHENKRLTDTITQLESQNKSINLEISQLTETHCSLQATQKQLEKHKIGLVLAIQNQSQLLDKAQEELDQVKKAYKANDARLSEKVMELKIINREMDQDLEQARSIGLVLESTVETLSKAVILDSEQCSAFQLRLKEFLANKSKSFDQISERICNAEYQLSAVTKELEQCNQKYLELLEKQGQLITEMEQLNKTLSITPQSPASALQKLGIYRFKQFLPHNLESTHVPITLQEYN